MSVKPLPPEHEPRVFLDYTQSELDAAYNQAAYQANILLFLNTLDELSSEQIPPWALGAADVKIMFLNAYDGGQAYTEGEYRQWLSEAGFENIRRDAPLGQLTICIAEKAG